MDPDHPALPVLPENVAISYEEAVDIAYAALTDYSDRITADYLDGLTLSLIHISVFALACGVFVVGVVGRSLIVGAQKIPHILHRHLALRHEGPGDIVARCV